MLVERCAQCGFDSNRWSDDDAVTAIGGLPDRWRAAAAGLTSDQLSTRPIPDMWSIGEYIDHVREVLFGMRFLLDTALTQPGTNLGEPPGSEFHPVPRDVDIDLALAGLTNEATALQDRLSRLDQDGWTSEVTVGNEAVDAQWIARHAVHDATHHLGDVAELHNRL